MTFHLPSFLRRVRIHGGEFDSSARAMNRVSEKGFLMTYEKAGFAQADPRIVRGSTIERKQMSTKTTFKRVALVAVATLTMGLFSPVSANAYVVDAGFRTLSWATTSATGTVGTEWSAVVKVNAACSELFTNSGQVETVTANMTAQLDQAPIGSNLLSNTPTWATGTPTGYTNTNAAAATAPFSDQNTGYRKATAITCVAASTPMVGYAAVKFTPDKPGTYVVVVLPVGSTTGITQAITVSAKTVGRSSAFIGTGLNDTATADATVSVTGAAATTGKARIDVAQMYGATGNDTASAADGGAVVLTIDKGLISKTNDYTGGAKSVTTAAGTSGPGGYAAYSYWIFSNGDIGKATITITVGGVALTSKTVTFTGPATAIAAALTTGQPAFAAVGATTTYTITATDAGGAAQATLPTGLTVKSSDTAVATVAIASGVVTVTGVKAGTSTITVTDPATTAAAPAITFVATVAPVRPTSVDITFDKATYNVGDLVTMTVSANMSDSATAQLFTSTGVALSSSVVASGTAVPTNGQHAIVGGKATYKFYAPAVSGNFVVTATSGGAVDVTTAIAISKTVAITNPGVDAATDAANEATDAANAATDAALAAAEAADAATTAAQEASDAVAALSETVTKLISDLQAQIKSLAAVVAKIAKKVKA